MIQKSTVRPEFTISVSLGWVRMAAATLVAVAVWLYPDTALAIFAGLVAYGVFGGRGAQAGTGVHAVEATVDSDQPSP